MKNNDYQKLAKLQSLLAIDKAKIASDPFPYINKLINYNQQLLQLIDDIELSLSPDSTFDYWKESAPSIKNPKDMEGEARIRCEKASALIRQFKSGD